ncbi:MAG: ribosome maturation factor RimP [Clostridia bacterium]|nr:ribosome maturation factor RimP [Clostridia bacterium]
MASVAEKVYNLIKDTVEAKNVSLWDVKFLKEGASYYLRVFIDKPDGVGIDDCTNVSHAIDPIIDEADPIEESYYLEVCSAGLERELTKDEHFLYAVGKNVKLKLFKGFNGSKTLEGKLVSFNNGIEIETDDGNILLERSQIAKASLNEI